MTTIADEITNIYRELLELEGKVTPLQKPVPPVRSDPLGMPEAEAEAALSNPEAFNEAVKRAATAAGTDHEAARQYVADLAAFEAQKAADPARAKLDRLRPRLRLALDRAVADGLIQVHGIASDTLAYPIWQARLSDDEFAEHRGFERKYNGG